MGQNKKPRTKAAKVSPASPKLEQAQGPSDPQHGEIAQLAYSYWEARGGQGCSPEEDWFRAEQELKARYASSSTREKAGRQGR